jgi:tape measure domain-containing protein
LLVAGVITDELVNKMTMLGDIASGANIPLQDMSAIFAKMKNKGKAMAEELAQMSERGIPIMRVLSEGTKKSIPELYKLAEKGAISFKVVEKAMASMAGKGGIFFKSMEKQSRTLGGIWSNVMDAISFSLASVGQNLVDTFALKESMNTFINGLNNITKSFNAWTKEHPKLTKWLFILIAVIAVIGPLLLIIGTLAIGFTALLSTISFVAAGIILLAKSISFLTVLYTAFNAVLLISPLGWLLITITAIAAAIVYFKDELGQLINKFTQWFSMKMPNWVKSLINMQTGGMFSGMINQTNTTEMINTNKGRAKVDVAISLEQLKGFNATAKSSVTGVSAGDLGLNLPGAQ